MRHKINAAQELDYTDYLNARDTQNDVGVDIKNPTERLNIENKKTEIVFSKKDNVSQYEGKEVELVTENNLYKIKSATTSATKKND